MYLEAVTCCVGYADFLCATAPWNRGLFDRWLIVTDPADRDTREVCRRYNLECLTSEDGQRDGASFAKGRLIERALQHTCADGWRWHLDADLALPSTTRLQLEAAHLDPACIYGIDRVLVRSYESWQKLLATGYLQQQWDYHCRVSWPAGYELGSRWASPSQGWVPIGFSQLWHSSADEWRGVRTKAYPARHGDACRTDVQFGLWWDRRQRALLPELIGVHLESEACAKGGNWQGRKTKPFGPPIYMPEEITGS